ncbi:MAG: hypothetical protein D6725_06315 [Planctomycetota bacterium]|nr:MAG: hypothetical protein D6725_06315 [Planctomycetota bacterium]
MTDSTPSLASRDIVRTAQIVSLGMISGVVLFALVVLAMGHPLLEGGGPAKGPQDAGAPAAEQDRREAAGEGDSLPVLPLVGVVVAVALSVGSFVLPTVVVRSMGHSAEGATPRNQNPYLTRTIVALALLEGAAMLNLVLEFVEPTGIGLGVVAVVLLLMLAHFPTLGRYEAFVQQMQEQAQLEGA